MPKRDPHIDAHLEWIGFVRPTGLVVSASALVRDGAILPRDPEGQRLLRACVAERRFHPDREPEPWLPDFRAFASSVLGWNFSPKGYAGTDESPTPPELETPLQEGGEILRRDFAVRERDPRGDASAWQLLVKVIETGEAGSAPAAGWPLVCSDHDAQGQADRVFWDYEIDRRILEEEGWAHLAERGFDELRRFGGVPAHAALALRHRHRCESSRRPSAPASASTPTRWSRSAKRCGCHGSTCSSPTTSSSARPLRRGSSPASCCCAGRRRRLSSSRRRPRCWSNGRIVRWGGHWDRLTRASVPRWSLLALVAPTVHRQPA